ncbi:unnamed protein product [Bursaphelenchus okinawaensis]|uniref:Uncharacterized protein n=1 Tax=Bursaphelenchus okinawaensis TaxID=465554 RepID=A0A811KTX9_9BILA|nr:unnamed protein product [Bursaphelenchus okinawaensis]CAG9110013.1 unnamed protein product [Bursaphelenchus okinawaensis]
MPDSAAQKSNLFILFFGVSGATRVMASRISLDTEIKVRKRLSALLRDRIYDYFGGVDKILKDLADQRLELEAQCSKAGEFEGCLFSFRLEMSWIYKESSSRTCCGGPEQERTNFKGCERVGLHEYMIERQNSYGAPHLRLSDARNSEIPGERNNYGKRQTQG